jgi:transcription-repair coupling factor (superfamily II helicase)
MQAGEYAVRGSIIDLLPSGWEDGIRIDYLGEEIESIKAFEPIRAQRRHK